MTSAETIDLTMIIIRGVVLILGALGAILAIFLGWRLYRDGIESAVSASASDEKRKVSMVAVGPGIFFALFGMILLCYLVRQQIEIEASSPVPAQLPAPAAQKTVGTQTAPASAATLTLVRAEAKPAVAAVPKPASASVLDGKPPCLYQLSRRKMFSGASFSIPRIRDDLAFTRDYLLKHRKPNSIEPDQLAIDDAVQTLDEILSQSDAGK